MTRFKPNFFRSRREFLKSSAALVAASQLPPWIDAKGATTPANATTSPNNQPAVALIGCGGMGRGDARNASKFGRIVAVCDVDEKNLAEAKKLWPDAAAYKDFRKTLEHKDLHAVICGTVDHWHTIISMAAMQAGKDVYCEKPLTLTIDEGKRLVATMRKTGRILQTGSQQRSDKNFRLACELVRNGRIGKLKHVQVFLPAGRREGPFQPAPVPAGLDWNFWQGQAPEREYVPQRCHGTFRYWYDYSGGTMTDWGAHHNDIALWGLGLDRSGPVSIEGKPLAEMIPGGFDAASEYEILYTYENGVTHSCKSTTADTWSGGVANKDGQRHGVRFEGSDGWIWVTRGNIQASNPEFLTTPLESGATRLYESNNHMENFFECMRSRKAPICDAEIGHRSATVCHLGVIAMRLGRKLRWDPKAEQFVGDAEANKWVAREMRKGFGYDMIA
ncbi:MAG TPA: Gfo/Idh/MocA family oxidoreductase [Methylomirabilota bacterium]|nr:Gfo/Idh/MocA family oxidoreductase [Methylomirabilota bacterium]